MNQIESIRKKLFSLQDKKYAGFQEKLIPGVDQLEVIGVRTPALRKLAKELYREGNVDEFLKDLPHRYFEENQLHAFIISEIKDYDVCAENVEKFLAYVDNWATCDQMSPKVFGKNKDKLLELCYRNSLQVAKEQGIRSIAFPSISTGVFYYPVEQAAKIAVKTVQKYMDENPDAFDLVMWVLFDNNTYGIYSEMIQ